MRKREQIENFCRVGFSKLSGFPTESRFPRMFGIPDRIGIPGRVGFLERIEILDGFNILAFPENSIIIFETRFNKNFVIVFIIVIIKYVNIEFVIKIC